MTHHKMILVISQWSRLASGGEKKVRSPTQFSPHLMRSLKFLIGAVGGLFGGMLLTNKHLRKKLRDARDPKEAAKIFGHEVQRGGKELAKEAKEWAGSDETQKRWKEMKKNLTKSCHTLQEEAEEIATEAVTKAKENLPEAKRKVQSLYKEAKKKVEEGN